MIEGVDVSGWQSQIDWHAVRASGREFVFVKVSEGLRRSPGLQRHGSGAGFGGLFRGGYHFARLEREGAKNARAQADYFVRAVPKTWRLAPVLDLELGGIPEHATDEAVVEWALAWCRYVTERYRRPIIYTGYWTCYRLHPHWMALAAGYKLWCAGQPYPESARRKGHPDILAGNWEPAVIQYDVHGHVPGYGGEIDLNRCADLTELVT